VRLLARASAEARESNLRHALNLADVAIAIAEALPVDYYPANGVYHLRGLAWKERANACRYMNRYADAYDACDHAERAYRRLLVHDLELAVMQYVRGTILWKQQRLDEALAVARTCAATFSNLRDHGRWINAKLLEGSILVDSHASDEAREIFLALSKDAEAMYDPATRARIENNLANAYLSLGDLGTASAHFIVALQLFESLSMATEATRARWKIGVVALVSGNTNEAARRLAVAKAECEAHQMLGDAALVTLDLAEAFLLIGNRDAAHRLALDVFEFARRAGMTPAALVAAAFLRENAKTGRLTTKIVRHVREFLRRLEAEPALIFEPPDHQRD
jgi:tetratricopeptide (TPR) repeat protein